MDIFIHGGFVFQTVIWRDLSTTGAERRSNTTYRIKTEQRPIPAKAVPRDDVP
jgi:hypothetical protein